MPHHCPLQQLSKRPTAGVQHPTGTLLHALPPHSAGAQHPQNKAGGGMAQQHPLQEGGTRKKNLAAAWPITALQEGSTHKKKRAVEWWL